jgi:hypothetical protein
LLLDLVQTPPGSELMEALPVALCHSDIIAPGAMVMSILGGLLIYTTITVYSHFFAHITDEF